MTKCNTANGERKRKAKPKNFASLTWLPNERKHNAHSNNSKNLCNRKKALSYRKFHTSE